MSETQTTRDRVSDPHRKESSVTGRDAAFGPRLNAVHMDGTHPSANVRMVFPVRATLYTHQKAACMYALRVFGVLNEGGLSGEI